MSRLDILKQVANGRMSPYKADNLLKLSEDELKEYVSKIEERQTQILPREQAEWYMEGFERGLRSYPYFLNNKRT